MFRQLRQSLSLGYLILTLLASPIIAQEPAARSQLPNGKILSDAPGKPRQTNNLPTAITISPDNRFAVLLHSGYGAYTSDQKQSLSVLNLETDMLADFPDDRRLVGVVQGPSDSNGPKVCCASDVRRNRCK